MNKLALRKTLKTLYQPSATVVMEADVPPFDYLMSDGQGDPNTAPAYARAVEALFSVAYTAKFALKKQNSELSTSVIRKGNFITQIRFSANAGRRQGAGMLSRRGGSRSTWRSCHWKVRGGPTTWRLSLPPTYAGKSRHPRWPCRGWSAWPRGVARRSCMSDHFPMRVQRSNGCMPGSMHTARAGGRPQHGHQHGHGQQQPELLRPQKRQRERHVSLFLRARASVDLRPYAPWSSLRGSRIAERKPAWLELLCERQSDCQGCLPAPSLAGNRRPPCRCSACRRWPIRSAQPARTSRSTTIRNPVRSAA